MKIMRPLHSKSEKNMGKQTREAYRASRTGQQLRNLVLMTSLGGLFLSLIGTFLIWAGTYTFNCQKIIWELALTLNFFFFFLAWVVYFPFRNTDRLLGNGLLAVLALFSLFWLFGFSMFYFYFLFSPIRFLPRAIALMSVTSMLLYRARLIFCDIKGAFYHKKNLFHRMYCDEGTVFTFRREAIGLIEKARKDRNPFKAFHAYVAMLVAPFVLVLNRVLTPVFGDGHGVFLILAFFSVPILLWGVEILVQTVMTMIYFPIKLERETGKPVLMKDW